LTNVPKTYVSVAKPHYWSGSVGPILGVREVIRELKFIGRSAMNAHSPAVLDRRL